MHKYKEYVDAKNIKIKSSKDKKHEYRYLLEIPFKNDSDKNVLIIMKNPSKATKTESDQTINKVLSYLRNDFKKVYIMNLFAIYSVSPLSIIDFTQMEDYTAHKEKNLKILKSTVKNVDEVIFAWGNPSDKDIEEFNDIILKVNKIVKASNRATFRIDNENPTHPQQWATVGGLRKNEVNIS